MGKGGSEPPLRGRLAETVNVTGDDEGRPYVGRGDGEGMMLEGEGRFANRPYGGGDGFPPPVFTEGRLFAGKTEEAGMTWWPTGNGDGRPRRVAPTGESWVGLCRRRWRP